MAWAWSRPSISILARVLADGIGEPRGGMSGIREVFTFRMPYPPGRPGSQTTDQVICRPYEFRHAWCLTAALRKAE